MINGGSGVDGGGVAVGGGVGAVGDEHPAAMAQRSNPIVTHARRHPSCL
jgi:hypothetical protein